MNAATKDGGTALRIAVILNLPEMAGLLIEYGADVYSFTDGMTNLEYALYYGKIIRIWFNCSLFVAKQFKQIQA